ncbi:MAG: succinyl-diaminopimelate desuccinylase, partial [Planctomycetota bacterium]
MDPTVELSRQLIQRRSVTPEDCGCIDLISERLGKVGFATERLEFGEVTNGWIRRGNESPLFVFAGHTDVVPPGPEDQWTHPPFDAIVDGDTLFGRGAADMKTGVAAMTIACEEFVTEHPDHKGSIGLLLTSDEEGPAVDGTVKVVQYLTQQNTKIDYCLVAEPSSTQTVGDEIKNGRRGSLNGHVTITGKQGHVAYPHLATNPIHQITDFLAELQQVEWDSGNEHFPATTFQVSNIQSGTGAENVIPATAEARFNFRFSTETTSEQIQQQVERILSDRGL